LLSSPNVILHLARALQAKQHELERQKQTDNLRKNLEKRPEREELVERENNASVF
jgi:uncharacterized membrane protein